MANAFYASQDEYQLAIADALHEEYKAITDAGLLLQVDDPQLVTYYMRNPDASVEACRRWAQRHVEVLNYALRGIPRERVRFADPILGMTMNGGWAKLDALVDGARLASEELSSTAHVGAAAARR